MKNMLKDFKKNMTIVAIAFLVVGGVLIAFPTETGFVASYVCGAAAIFYGVTHIIAYFSMKFPFETYRFDLVQGLAGVILGLYVVMFPAVVFDLLPIGLGIAMIVDSVIKLQNAIDLYRLKYEQWWIILIFALVGVLLGVLMIYYPFMTYLSIMTFIGIGLLIEGVLDLVTIFILTKRFEQAEADMEAAAKGVEPTSEVEETVEAEVEVEEPEVQEEEVGFINVDSLSQSGPKETPNIEKKPEDPIQ